MQLRRPGRTGRAVVLGDGGRYWEWPGLSSPLGPGSVAHLPVSDHVESRPIVPDPALRALVGAHGNRSPCATVVLWWARMIAITVSAVWSRWLRPSGS